MKKKGFTLIELLVVIAIIAMLLAVLMPALNKVKRLAQRLVCGTNVKGLGTAMMVYAQDFEDEFPLQGGSGDHYWSQNGATKQWWDPDKNWNDDGFVTVASSLYLLVRNADVDPKSFICPSGDEKAFKGVSGNANLDLVELWDFGGKDIDQAVSSGNVTYSEGLPREHVSYAFQLPYGVQSFVARPASATSSASTAILADKNPWQDPKLDHITANPLPPDSQSGYMMQVAYLIVDWANDDPLRDSSTAWQVQITNSQPHGREGQNVLYGDGHATFEKRPDVSYQNDNIYTMFATTGGEGIYNEYDRRTGLNRPTAAPTVMPTSGNGPGSYPRTDEDSVLVNDDRKGDPELTNG
ncbi:MAG: type II secretion system protein [Planctomycetota bacterium]